jgi:hypothetical protein
MRLEELHSRFTAKIQRISEVQDSWMIGSRLTRSSSSSRLCEEGSNIETSKHAA